MNEESELKLLEILKNFWAWCVLHRPPYESCWDCSGVPRFEEAKESVTHALSIFCDTSFQRVPECLSLSLTSCHSSCILVRNWPSAGQHEPRSGYGSEQQWPNI